MSEKKLGNLSIRLDKDLLNDYKSLCEKNGYDVSKRLRIYMKDELESDLTECKEIKVDNILYKPEITFEKVEIYGVNFFNSNKSPNVFVLETNNEIMDGMDIFFTYNGLKYSIKCISIIKPFGFYNNENRIIIESKYWEEKMDNL